MSTILQDIKEALGVDVDNLGFDKELLMIINAVRAELVQHGIIEFEAAEIVAEDEWPVFTTLSIGALTKGYMILKIRQLFDMSANQSISATLQSSINLLEGRMIHEVETVVIP